MTETNLEANDAIPPTDHTWTWDPFIATYWVLSFLYDDSNSIDTIDMARDP